MNAPLVTVKRKSWHKKAICRECYRLWKGVFRKEAVGTCDKCGQEKRALILVPKI